jgi:serine/threonine protein kinase
VNRDPSDVRLEDVLLEYVEARQAGQQPDRSKLLSAHPELREELETFFSCQDEVERVVAPLRAAAGQHEETAGARDLGQLGDFRLLLEVGRGGMGVVYDAVQLSLERRVALKVLPFAAAIDDRQLQRFKNEALAAAQLRHENIVPVYSVGCERGVHYYAMQFIEGQSLAALIAELRLQPGVQGNRETALAGQGETKPGSSSASAAAVSRLRALDSRRYFDWVAGLGRQAAAALEHAHQAGIVHRDVKPGNLLLDFRGHLWVTDFGLALVSGDPGVTRTGEMLGTLRYCSPEQALARRGVVDHRSDVYALGATLYELITLKPIFEGRDRNELLRQIAGEDPPPPRSVVPSLPAELETVVLKALRKEPSERYACAQDLADDLERYLERRPVLARRPTLADRSREWARRHPALVGAAALVVILTCAGSLVSAALLRAEQGRTLAEQRRAEEAYQLERQRAEEAEARFRLARRSVDELIQVSEEELADRPGMEGVRKRLLRSALAYYQEFIDQRRDDPDARAELLDTKRRVEKILADLTVLRAASKLYLLCQSVVLDDLGLDGAQRARMKGLTARVGKQWLDSFNDVGRLSQAERRRRMIEQARANELAVNSILTAAQQSRLRQIGWQSEGPSAFRDPEVVAELKLTPAQREQIRTIEEAALVAWMRNTWRGPVPEKGKQDPRPRGKPANEQILEVLSDEQRRRWRRMSGTPVKGTLAPFGAPAR